MQMLYASETWILTKDSERQIHSFSFILSFEMKYYRRITRIGWSQKELRTDKKSIPGSDKEENATVLIYIYIYIYIYMQNT